MVINAILQLSPRRETYKGANFSFTLTKEKVHTSAVQYINLIDVSIAKWVSRYFMEITMVYNYGKLEPDYCYLEKQSKLSDW